MMSPENMKLHSEFGRFKRQNPDTEISFYEWKLKNNHVVPGIVITLNMGV